MFTVYILHSESGHKYYVGHTSDIEERVRRHNEGKVPFTAKYGQWRVVYTEMYDNKSEAIRRELEIKAYKGGIQFKKLLGLWSENPR